MIGTTSGGVNWGQGRRDYVYSTPRAEMMRAYGAIARSTALPVSGDLENGYGAAPEAVAATIEASIAEGMVGGSIEDQDLAAGGGLFPRDLAVVRIEAARKAADASGAPYVLTARCEAYFADCADPFAEAVERLNAYRAAGADCLFAPGLNARADLAQLAREVDGPINFGMGATAEPITLSMLEDLGVRRVSTGGGLTRATYALIERAAQDIMTTGRFDYLADALSEAQINEILEKTIPDPKGSQGN